MGDTTPERLTKVETLVDVQQKQLDEHEERISSLENMGVILDKLSGTVDRTNSAVNGILEIINDVKNTTQELKLAQTRIETKQSYWITDGIIGLCKKIGWKGFVGIVIAGCSGFAYLNSVLHIWG